MSDLITLDNLLTSSGKYPARAKDKECTDAVKKNAAKLLVAVNAFLKELGLTKVDVSSGFRTTMVNKGTPGAAKKSLHCEGSAIDIYDPKQEISKLILSKPDLLKKHGLWIEDPSKTPTWTHLDNKPRSDRKINKFMP